MSIEVETKRERGGREMVYFITWVSFSLESLAGLPYSFASSGLFFFRLNLQSFPIYYCPRFVATFLVLIQLDQFSFLSLLGVSEMKCGGI